MQGCCIALALAARGASVTLYDKNESLLSRAAIANEGRIHLGHIYAGDRSLATARMMIRGALSFAPFFERYLGLSVDALAVSEPTSYLVHRDSQRGTEDIAAYFETLHDLLSEAVSDGKESYFGRELDPPRRWSDSEVEAEFDPSVADAVFDTPEAALEPRKLADSLVPALVGEPRVELVLETDVLAVEASEGLPSVLSRTADGHRETRQYSHVVNALWEGRLAVDATLGLFPQRSWINRFKYGIRFRPPVNFPSLPTVAVLLGPFGELLTYQSGMIYSSWYPACMRRVAYGAEEPVLPMYPDEALKREIVAGTIAGMSGIVPKLRDLDTRELSDTEVIGGVIVAPGRTDIPDPTSELHTRHGMGVTTHGSYHSVYPGKFTLTPYLAELCANRILGP